MKYDFRIWKIQNYFYNHNCATTSSNIYEKTFDRKGKITGRYINRYVYQGRVKSSDSDRDKADIVYSLFWYCHMISTFVGLASMLLS